MRKSLTLLLLLVLLTGCRHSRPPIAVDILLPYTPVKNQGEGATCWIYAMLATIETEHIVRGDSVNLSAYYVEKMMEREPQAPASRRGTLATALYMIGRHGLVPYSSMHKPSLPAPERAFMLGCEYTPLEFAHSVCAPGEYVSFWITEDGPYGEMVDVPTADNWSHERSMTVSPDSVVGLVQRALMQGHPVAWEGDISELGFDWERGVARTSWWNGHTTDDHCMSIVGLAHDKRDGERYFMMKNSWGTDNEHGGLLYMSADYLREKTVMLVMSRAAL